MRASDQSRTNQIESEANASLRSIRWAKFGAVLAALALTAAACGTAQDDTVDAAAEDVAAPAQDSDDDAMEDDAMEDDEDATEDDAMEDDEDAMEDDEDAMEDGDAMDDAEHSGVPLDISFSGLEPLGENYNYEVWSIVDDAPVTGGLFDIAADGSVETEGLFAEPDASAVVITIEPAVGDDPAPSDTHVLAGDVAEDGTFELTIDHPAALGTDFSDAAGSFVLATPTDDDDTNELAGVWFLTLPGPEASLSLPELPAGWEYEGWAVVEGADGPVPLSTGRFTDVAAADDFNGFSGPNAGPNYPGEDFLVNAPEGLTFPLDLSGATVVISVEPAPDDSPAPFALKPLVGDVPEMIGDHQDIALGAGPVDITGSGSIEG